MGCQFKQRGVGEIGTENAYGDSELVERDQATAQMRGRDFGNIERRKHRSHSNPQSADKPIENQNVLRLCDGAADRRERKEHGRQQ